MDIVYRPLFQYDFNLFQQIKENAHKTKTKKKKEISFQIYWKHLMCAGAELLILSWLFSCFLLDNPNRKGSRYTFSFLFLWRGFSNFMAVQKERKVWNQRGFWWPQKNFLVHVTRTVKIIKKYTKRMCINYMQILLDRSKKIGGEIPFPCWPSSSRSTDGGASCHCRIN